MKSINRILADKYPPMLVKFDSKKRAHREALEHLIFDFLDIEESDPESDKYTKGVEAYLLEKQWEYLACLVYRVPVEQPSVVYISALSVLSSQRGKHYGFFMLSHFIDIVKRQGRYRSVQLSVNDDNEAAIALYQRLGFKTVKTEVDEGRKFFRMELQLSEYRLPR